jgi:hypothetical protein
MDHNAFNLFIKLLKEEYRLSDSQLTKISRRLLADNAEFERVWKLYQAKTLLSGVDEFKQVLQELLT